MEGRAKVRRFEAHGAFFQSRTGPDDDGDYHQIADCPFCDRRKKFYVNETTLKWDCKVCQCNGEYIDFLEQIAKRNHETFLKSPQIQKELAKDRGLKRATLRKAGIGFFGGTYTIPVHHGNAFVDLLRYSLGGKLQQSLGGRKGIFGSADIRNKTEIWIAEGVWDCLALRELFQQIDVEDADVVAVPGADTFWPKWAGFFNNRRVFVAYDADGLKAKFAAQKGMQKVQGILRGAAKELHFVHWPEGLPEGYDIRDLYHDKGKKAFRLLQKYMQKEPPKVPEKQVLTRKKRKKKPKRKKAKPISRARLIKEYQKWLYMTNDEVEILDVIFGAMYANRMEGDPLWLFVVGPPGCGKTELLMTLSKSDFVYPSTTLTTAALISGAQLKDGADPSLLPQLDGLVWVIKDFTTILSMPFIAVAEIFGILRDAFDGKIKKVFGTGVVRDYESKFGIIAGVTHHINAFHQNTTVGERFLRYNMRHKAQSAGSAALITAAMDNINVEDTMREALQKVAKRAVDKEALEIPDITEYWKKHIIPLAQWISHMRGAVMRDRYSDEIIYSPAAEIGTRVAKQLTKLAMGIAMFRGEREIGEEVYRTVIRVARDTAPDRAELIAKRLYLSKQPITASRLSYKSKLEVGTVRKVLRDMRLLRIVDKLGEHSQQWVLTAKMRKMMDLAEVYFDERVWKRAHRRKEKRRGK